MYSVAREWLRSATRNELEEMCTYIHDTTLQHVLYSRFIEAKPWWKVAIDTNYSEASVYRLYERLLAEVERILTDRC